MERKVAISYYNNVKYPNVEEILYPDEQYKELNIKYGRYSKDNKIYKMIRECFMQLELDKFNVNTSNWNPLGDNLIVPGNTVLIKPNLVLEKNQGNGGEECLYTNPSLVAAIVNYVWIALKGKGKIIIADAPVQKCNFNELIEKSGYKKMIEFFKKEGVNIELKDLRGLVLHYKNGTFISETFEQDGIVVDLKNNSEHSQTLKRDLKKLRITNYDPRELLKHHNTTKHEYLIAKEALEADVIINMPKPKSHRKAGVTIGLKNFVGINTRKEYLPHHKLGSKKAGGDEYLKKSITLKISSFLLDMKNIFISNKRFLMVKVFNKMFRIVEKIHNKFFFKESYREGSWYGNDTIWRTIVDINMIVKYADKKGIMQNTPQRKIFNVADMIIIGEKEGPMMPSPKYAGIIAVSDNIVCFDEIVASIMGLDIKKIPLLKNIRNKRKYKLVNNEDIGIIVSNNKLWNGKKASDINKSIALNIEPSSGWKGHIELN